MFLDERLAAGEIVGLLMIVLGGLVVVVSANVESEAGFWLGVAVALVGWVLQGWYGLKKRRGRE